LYQQNGEVPHKLKTVNMKYSQLMKDYDQIENNVLTLLIGKEQELIESVKIKLEHMRNLDNNRNKTIIEFAMGMIGFLNWSQTGKINGADILITLLHDINEFLRNHEEKWFCPRTHGYIKYY